MKVTQRTLYTKGNVTTIGVYRDGETRPFGILLDSPGQVDGYLMTDFKAPAVEGLGRAETIAELDRIETVRRWTAAKWSGVVRRGMTVMAARRVEA